MKKVIDMIIDGLSWFFAWGTILYILLTYILK